MSRLGGFHHCKALSPQDSLRPFLTRACSCSCGCWPAPSPWAAGRRRKTRRCPRLLPEGDKEQESGGWQLQGPRSSRANTSHPARFPGLFPALWNHPGALEGGLGGRAVPTGRGLSWCSPGLLFLWETGAVRDLEAAARARSVPDFQMTLGWESQPAAAPSFPWCSQDNVSPPHWYFSLIYLP